MFMSQHVLTRGERQMDVGMGVRRPAWTHTMHGRWT